MELKELLENFTLERSDERECIGDNLFTALQEPPQKFKEVAKAILSGHFIVDGGDARVEVHPVCVEIYYHEEQANGVKDPIVYHRNRKKKSGEENPSVFDIGVLHNHVSGIDITFEHKTANNEIVRASALIREFMVKGKDGKWMEMTKIKNGRKVKSDIEDRSTHIYDYLFGKFSIFGGFTVRWEDGEEVKNVTCAKRKNVFEYELPHKDKDEYDYHKTTRSCLRRWQFRRNDK